MSNFIDIITQTESEAENSIRSATRDAHTRLEKAEQAHEQAIAQHRHNLFTQHRKTDLERAHEEIKSEVTSLQKKGAATIATLKVRAQKGHRAAVEHVLKHLI